MVNLPGLLKRSELHFALFLIRVLSYNILSLTQIQQKSSCLSKLRQNHEFAAFNLFRFKL